MLILIPNKLGMVRKCNIVAKSRKHNNVFFCADRETGDGRMDGRT